MPDATKCREYRELTVRLSLECRHYKEASSTQRLKYKVNTKVYNPLLQERGQTTDQYVLTTIIILVETVILLSNNSIS